MIEISELKSRAQEYEKILSVSILEDTPFIVEVGALTVTTDKNNIIKLQRTAYPTQFSKKAISQIKTCNFQNNSGTVEPVVYSRIQWYRKELDALKQTINLFENIPTQGGQ